MVVFPQPLELSSECRYLSWGNPQLLPQRDGQETTGEIQVIHKSTPPYYNYYLL